MVPEPAPPSETKCATVLHSLCDWRSGCLACAANGFDQLDAALCTWAEIEELCKG